MHVINHTPFPALRLEGENQHGQAFHVLVLRQTLSFATGVLEYADEQAPLCDSDIFFGELNASSMREESDFCEYKPKCDIIVNATAHAPGGKATRRFLARMVLRQPDTPAAKPGRRLIDKSVWVIGERQFKKRGRFTRAVFWLLRIGTLTLLRPAPWKLTRASPFLSLALRYEFAYGGYCKIYPEEPGARHVPKAKQCSPEQRAAGPDFAAAAEMQALAHQAFEGNPVGQGFAQDWFVKANRMDQVPAPRIERDDGQVTAKQFARWLSMPSFGKGEPADRIPLHHPAGFGIVTKTSSPRAELLGTISAEFTRNFAGLPRDFDPAYWNAAPVDQQVRFLAGDETLELHNLCAPDAPGARVASNGDTLLALALLRHECFVTIIESDGLRMNVPMNLDTLIAEPDDNLLTLVWRVTVRKLDGPDDPDCEIRMWTHEDRARSQADASVAQNAGVA
jgi:hypothetical protein